VPLALVISKLVGSADNKCFVVMYIILIASIIHYLETQDYNSSSEKKILIVLGFNTDKETKLYMRVIILGMNETVTPDTTEYSLASVTIFQVV
jgi:hypothetical protein